MKKKSLDLSKKIDKFFIDIFKTISLTADQYRIPFFVIGATARYILFEKGYGIKTGRATLDIDLGVKVSDWDLYRQLISGLVATGAFVSDRKNLQRLLYQKSFPVDVIPFGTIEEDDNSILWPPDNDIKMSILGFEDAYRAAFPVKLRKNPVLEINFTSLAGLTILKLISWHDDVSRRGRDAKDLLLLMKNYIDAGNQERFYNYHMDLFEKSDKDYELESARLLGMDVANILRPKTKKVILDILNKETAGQTRYKLARDMMGTGIFKKDSFEKILKFLQNFKSGVLKE